MAEDFGLYTQPNGSLTSLCFQDQAWHDMKKMSFVKTVSLVAGAVLIVALVQGVLDHGLSWGFLLSEACKAVGAGLIVAFVLWIAQSKLKP
jgi:hypothetical protein